ncbi:MAG TPA: ATP-binding protein [Verrucomicrobiae bacterium]|nr:ATP-binding protein [Verrucomicrobiae bacterium]
MSALSAYAAITAASVGFCVLIGWLFHIDFLKRVLPGLVAMNPVTALGFVFGGAALWLSIHARAPWSESVAQILAALVLAIGVLRLSGYLFAIPFQVDRLLFAPLLFEPHTQLPNRMAPNTAFNFTCIGAAILFLNSRSQAFTRASHSCAIVSLALSILALFGYAFETAAFYRVAVFIPMAVHTAFSFLILSLGLLFARPDRGIVQPIACNSLGAITARRLLPAALLLQLPFAWLSLRGVKAGWYDTSFALAIAALANMVTLTALIWWNAVSLNRAEQRIELLNDDLQRRATELQQLNKDLESFSYSVSHDLRAPVRHIRGFLELLQESLPPALDDKSKRYLGVIADSAAQMARLIDDLLNFSRTGRAAMRLSPVQLHELVTATIQELAPEAAGRRISWNVHTLPTVHADLPLMRQVIRNLLSNALKYSRGRQTSEIEIGSLASSNPDHVIFVRDNGVGFDMQFANKLFGVFQRLHDAEEFEGTGIGLANVQRIISRHGGRTWAEAAVNRGATFYFSLPQSQNS